MKYLRQTTTIIVSILLISILHQGCDSTDFTKFDNAVEELNSYQFGDSRTALSEIETFVALAKDEDDKKIIAASLAKVLESDVSFAAKQFVCQQLHVIGNKEQIPQLTKLLLSEETADIAIFAMEFIPSPKIDETFRNSLSKLNDKSKIGVINALGERRNKESVQAISPFLSDSNNDIAKSAALALGKIGSSEAGLEIKKVLDTTRGKWREKLEYAYLMCANNMAANGDVESAVKIYQEVTAQTENKHIQMLAQSSLVTTGHMDAEVFVSQAINDTDSRIRRLAIRIVIETPGEDATLKFCAILTDLPENSQRLLLIALSDRGDPMALETVRKVINHKNKEVRIAALKAIASLGNETMVPVLMQIIVKSDDKEREAARTSLYQLKGSLVDKEILQMTGDDKLLVRVESIKALSARNYSAGKPILLELLNSPDESIRLTCWEALKGLGSGGDIEQMVSFWVKSKSSTEIQIAEDAVVAIFRKEATHDKAMANILAALNTQQNKQIKISLINGLGKIGDEKSLPQLRILLDNKDPEISTTAIRALSSWPNAEPHQDLRKVIVTTDDQKQKVIALRGYIHLIGLESTRKSDKTVELYGDALNLAWRPEEKKLVLAGYAEVYNLAALNALEGYFMNDELKNEATAAALNICEEMIEESIDKKERESIAGVLEKIVQKSGVESMRIKATDMLISLED